MSEVYKGVSGWVGGVQGVAGVGGKPLGHRQWCCVFSKGQRQVQSTGYTEMVVSSSVAPLTSLLMPSRGLLGSVVHLCGFTGWQKAFCESRLHKCTSVH